MKSNYTLILIAVVFVDRTYNVTIKTICMYIYVEYTVLMHQNKGLLSFRLEKGFQTRMEEVKKE